MPSNFFTDEFFRTVGRHLVTLSCVQRSPGQSVEKTHVFSGFLIEVNGAWLYVTAGHIIRDIRRALNGGAEFSVWRLDDQTAGNRFNGIAIPFDFDPRRWCVIEDPTIGLDYAAVPLDPMYCRQLEAGGALPLGRDAWGDHVAEYDFWALVGIPSETVAYDSKSIITGRIAVMPLVPVEEPEMAGRTVENKFFGRITDAGNIKDIDGMSGGPIFSLKKKDGVWRYTVIGVQSGWYPSARIVAACPILSFAVELEKVVRGLGYEARSPA